MRGAFGRACNPAPASGFVQICPDQSGWGSIRVGLVRLNPGESGPVRTAREGESRSVTGHAGPSDRCVSGEFMRTGVRR